MPEEQEPQAGTAPAPSSEPVTQEPGPSKEAPAPAAQVGPVSEPESAEELVPIKRLHRQQSAMDKMLRQEREGRERQKQEYEALKARLREVETRGMDEGQRAKYEASERATAFQQREQELEQREQQIQYKELMGSWYNYYLHKGVPSEVLKECETYEDMVEASTNYLVEKAGGGTQSAKPPPVGPGDKIQSGAGGAPPGREFDKVAAGEATPGTPAYRKWSTKTRREKRLV